ncbi:hypothetical protein LSCM1_01107 [Leishmania martiniquensis]|uniref:Uncharacterized protein n=1 Tax=Leishmania martiniquensis TaxID=1580590 RepID=A0A836GY50_9TRYP|nr:hypothetical protein LSCM1_01107 [Leishmania martiniquensis]
MPSYRLEVAVRRVYGLTPLIASAPSKIIVEVRFLDFPPIMVHPHGYAVGDAVTYNVCHKADFRMSSEQAATSFPAMCQCQLVSLNEGAVAGAARWLCPCSLVPQPDAAAQTSPRTYAIYVISNAAGETVGYADMSCRVFLQDAPPTVLTQAPASGPVYMPAPEQEVTPVAVAAPPTCVPEASMGARADMGKPYIVRVVVGESDRHRRSNQAHHGDRMQEASRGDEATAIHASVSDRGHPPRRVTANTAEKGSLLHLLQYDVAYQLQSLSETVAAALHREHDVLTRTPLKGPDKSSAVSTSKLAESINHHVANIVKVANIVLQVANQLVDNSPAPPRIGTSRQVKDMARQRRNPVNKLPVPAEGSVGHFLQYDVLYQLQCLGTNLSYMTIAYRAALDIPLSSIPAQHIEYCNELGHAIQHLTKHIHILVQSSVDGILSSTAPGPVAQRKSSKRREANSQSASQAATPQRAADMHTDVAKSSSSSSYSSFSSSRSTSSSSTSSSSSLNRPATPASPAQPRAAVSTLANPPPAVSSPRSPSPSLPPPSSYAMTASTTMKQTSPPPATAPPPPYTPVSTSAQPTATPLPEPPKSQTRFSPSNSADPFSAPTARSQENQLVSPEPQINQASIIQPPAVAPSTLSVHTAPQSTGMYGTAASAFAPQPDSVARNAPALNPPYFSSVTPPLAAPTLLTSPNAAPLPPSIAPPTLATPPPVPPQPPGPLAIPIPIPLPP